MKGIFITFEGGEGCGKSTQAKHLSDYLQKQGYNTFLTREPGGPKISEAIRTMLLSNENHEMDNRTEVLLYCASRAQHTAEWILPKLNAGYIVISDRYFDSTSAYQGAARQIPANDVNALHSFATFGLVPDLTFLIDLDVKTGLGRLDVKKIDRLESESFEFHQRVRDGYLDIAKKNSDRFIVIDGDRPIEVISIDILEIIKKIIKGR